MTRQVDEATTAARRAEAGEAGSLGVGVHVSVAAPVLSVVCGTGADCGRPSGRALSRDGPANSSTSCAAGNWMWRWWTGR